MTGLEQVAKAGSQRDSNENMLKKDTKESTEQAKKEKKEQAASSGQQGFKLGRPKPPPPPKPTPAEVRMAKHCEALTAMCACFEELARMEHAEHTLLHRVRFAIPQRLAAIDKELTEVRASRDVANDASAAMQRNELDEALRDSKIRELEQEEKALHDELASSRALCAAAAIEFGAA